MAGVVRRDGLREPVTTACGLGHHEQCSGTGARPEARIVTYRCACPCHRDADPDTPTANRTIGSVTDHDATPTGPAMIPPTADAVPDVPPDPPAAELDDNGHLIAEIARVLERDFGSFLAQQPHKPELFWRVNAESMLPLVRAHAADVQARALEDAADDYATRGRSGESRAEIIAWLRDRAVSEREGTT